MNPRIMLALACLLLLTHLVGGKKAYDGNKYKAQPKDYNSGGPDNARYVYSAPFYDHRTYKNADIRLDRFPGGVVYALNEHGYGANVKVNFQSYPSGNYAGNNKG